MDNEKQQENPSKIEERANQSEHQKIDTVSSELQRINLDDLSMRSMTNAKSWSVGQFVSQEKLIEVFQVSTKETAGTKLFSFRNQPRVIEALHFDFLRDYWFCQSWRVVLRFEIQSHKQQVGSMIFTFMNAPYDNAQLYGFDNGSVETQSIYDLNRLPNCIVQYGEQLTKEFTLSWNTNLRSVTAQFSDSGYGKTDQHLSYNLAPGTLGGQPDMGCLALHVFDDLKIVTGGVNTFQVRVTSRLESLEYAGYQPNTARE